MTLIQVMVIICPFVNILCLVRLEYNCASNFTVENMNEV